jgi:hypothetical protein
MEKTALVGIIFIALVILLASYSYTFLLRKSKIKILSNVTELYSLFTPYMENHVNIKVPQSLFPFPLKF